MNGSGTYAYTYEYNLKSKKVRPVVFALKRKGLYARPIMSRAKRKSHLQIFETRLMHNDVDIEQFQRARPVLERTP